jgi:hypothetical protein
MTSFKARAFPFVVVALGLFASFGGFIYGH